MGLIRWYKTEDIFTFINTNSMSSALRPHTTYKEKTMLKLLYTFTVTPHLIMGEVFAVLTRDPRNPCRPI